MHAEVLVKWAQPSDCDHAWETLEGLQLRFLDLYLEDKVKVLRVSINRRKVVNKVYVRANGGETQLLLNS